MFDRNDYEEHGMSESEFVGDDEQLDDEDFAAFRSGVESEIVAAFGRSVVDAYKESQS